MKSVVTLISPPDKENLTEALVAEIRSRLADGGAQVPEAQWLSEGVACDVFFLRIDPADGERIAREIIGDREIDCIAHVAGERRKRLFIADMDSTIITVECIDEIADFAGVKPQVAAITERAMRGEIDFAVALTERVGLLAGLPVATLEEVYASRVKFTPGARELVATMKNEGAYTMLVSGGFDFFTSRVREELGFDVDHSNRLEVADGKLTGKVLLPILGRDAKLQSLMQACITRGISTGDTLAVGDGANDVPMLMAAGLGVAYHAKPVVQQSARARVNHTDLTALLYAQGYREEEIVR